MFNYNEVSFRHTCSYSGSRATLKDKDNDKDAIIDEEKARENAASETNKDREDQTAPPPTTNTNNIQTYVFSLPVFYTISLN